MQISLEVSVPEITERQVWNAPTKLKRTATGPDDTSFWIWKDCAELLRRFSLKSGICRCQLTAGRTLGRGRKSTPYQRPTPLSPTRKLTGTEATTSQEHSKKVVYHTHDKAVIEKNLSPTQFAYRQEGNCTNAFLSIQRHVYRHLDNSDCKAVRLFTLDFSRTFDSVNHSKLSAKLKQLPLSPNIVNLYHTM